MDFSIEIVHLKEDLFKELREIESKFSKMFAKKSLEIENKNKSSLEKIDIMMKKNEQMFNSINNQQIKLEKIVELDSFKNKINDMIIAHEYRIQTLTQDFENIKFKYDREISQNLLVPGFVGPSCQFKSISEYLLFNFAEINKLKGEKDLTKKENKEMKSKYDSIMKNIINLVDNSFKRCNEYTDNKQKDFEKLLNTKLNEFNEKNMEMKTQVMMNQKAVNEEINKILKISEELMKLKDDVESLINNKYDELNIIIKELKNKIDKMNNEIKKHNKNFDSLNSTFRKSGIFAGNNNIFKSTSYKYQKRKSIVNVNNNNTNNSNTNNSNNQNESKDKKLPKKNSVFQRQKNIKYESSKANKTIKKYSFDNNKENKNINVKESNTINTANNQSKENKKKKSNSIYNIKNNEYKNQLNTLFNKKRDVNDVSSIEEKISTERKIKNAEKKVRKIIEINKKINLSDDENEEKKNKIKISKFFEKINLNKSSNISSESKSKENKNNNEQNIKINNAKENVNENININTFKNNYNNNEMKKLSYFSQKKNNKENLFIDKHSDLNPIEKYMENSKILNNKNKTNLYKYNKKMEPFLITEKINSINYPNEEMKNINKKDDLFQEFLERHNLKVNRSLESKKKNQYSKKNDYYTISNKMYGTKNNNLINNNLDNYNNIYKINTQNLLLKEGENIELNKRNIYTQGNTKNTINTNSINTDTPENINYKLISFDNNYHSPLNIQQKSKTRNNHELLLPITNIFKTFQVNKYKNIINNIEDYFPSKISPIFGRTGYFVYNKRKDIQKHNKNLKNNINIYRKTKNQNETDVDLGLAPKKVIKIYV